MFAIRKSRTMKIYSRHICIENELYDPLVKIFINDFENFDYSWQYFWRDVNLNELMSLYVIFDKEICNLK